MKLCGHCDPDQTADYQHATGHCLGAVPLGGENSDGLTVEANQDPDCLTIRQPGGEGEDEDIIHVCDWPAMRAVIDEFQAARHPVKGE